MRRVSWSRARRAGILSGRSGRRWCAVGRRTEQPEQRTISFLASLPPIQSAISLAGDGGARIKLDVDESQMGAVMWLATLRGLVFRVTVEAEPASSGQVSKSQF